MKTRRRRSSGVSSTREIFDATQGSHASLNTVTLISSFDSRAIWRVGRFARAVSEEEDSRALYC